MAQEPIIGSFPGPKEDRGFWLDFSLALVMAIAWGCVYFGYQHVVGARRNNTMAAARVELNDLEHEMDNRYGRVANDLREFGTWLEYASTDSISAGGLHVPLAPYVRRDPAIRAARLANEHGDQWTVTNLDTALLISEQHWKDSTIVEWIHKPRIPNDTIRFDTLAGLVDPRSSEWFGASLQDRRGGALWGAPFLLEDSTGVGITLSIALRNDTGLPITRVFAFDMRLLDPADLLPPTRTPNGPRLFILGPDGEQMLPSAAIPGGLEALAEWKARAEPETLWVMLGERLHALIVVPYPMNGVELKVGVLMPLAQLSQQERTSQYLLIGNAALVVLLSLLLIAAYRRRRRESQQHRQQQERSRSQRQRLAKAIGEREVLNREVHHRVKNNLQVVTSLLNLQLRKLEEGAAKDEFKRGVRRIDSMAVVHHKLYGLQDLRGIDLQKFFTGLVDSIALSTDTKGTTVSCAVDTAGVKADADTAIELGVILCELVGNCYQHAFPFATGGHIEVTVRHVEGDLHRLVVKDNGLGLGASPTDGTGKLGLEIVEALSSQLDGNFKMSSSAGVTFDVLFRMSKSPQR